jgi:hypothetical protein
MAVCMLFSALNLAAQTEQAFRGAITDSVCLESDGHAAMLTNGETLSSCTIARLKTRAKYVLYSAESRTVYQLDDQLRSKNFAARNVVAIGNLDKATNTIDVYDIIPALPPKVTRARFVYIDCDACLRGMANAKQAALEGLRDWNRFSVVPDRRRADLVFLFSANRYLGDYLSRQGPDTRPVRVGITFMNVIDPSTGESLWSDSSSSGSWRVVGGTKDLITKFRGQLEAGEGRVDRLLLQDNDRTARVPPGAGK